MKVVAVKFKEPKLYSKNDKNIYNSSNYYCRAPIEVHAGDEVVVDLSPHGLLVGMVYDENIESITPYNLSGCIVQKVDRTHYNEFLEYDRTVKEIRLQLENRVNTALKNLTTEDLCKFLAISDPVLDSLLEQYEEAISNYNSF